MVFYTCKSPTSCGHMKSHVHNNEEMEFVYTEIHVFLALLVQERFYEDSVGQRHLIGRGI